MKKSLEKSKNILEEKRKKFQRKIGIKETNTFTKIAMNFVQEQLTRSTKKFQEATCSPEIRSNNFIISRTQKTTKPSWTLQWKNFVRKLFTLSTQIKCMSTNHFHWNSFLNTINDQRKLLSDLTSLILLGFYHLHVWRQVSKFFGKTAKLILPKFA